MRKNADIAQKHQTTASSPPLAKGDLGGFASDCREKSPLAPLFQRGVMTEAGMKINILFWSILLCAAVTALAADPYAARRQQMVEHDLKGRGIADARVLAAMAQVPRHLFVADSLQNQAYGDHPLPIAEGQTISQPYVVALMTEAVRLKPTDRVLEIGTGSGYQAAVLAGLV